MIPIDNFLAPRELLHAQDVCRANGTPAATVPPWRKGDPRGGPSMVVLTGLAAAALAAIARRRLAGALGRVRTS